MFCCSANHSPCRCDIAGDKDTSKHARANDLACILDAPGIPSHTSICPTLLVTDR